MYVEISGGFGEAKPPPQKPVIVYNFIWSRLLSSVSTYANEKQYILLSYYSYVTETQKKKYTKSNQQTVIFLL